MKKMLERLEKIDPDSYQNLKDVIERHTEFTEKLNMMVDFVPLLLAYLNEKNNEYIFFGDVVLDVLNCNTSEEVLELIKKEVKEMK